MWQNIGKRFFDSFLVFFGVLTLTFVLIKWVPGGPFDEEKACSETLLKALNAHYGLDQSLIKQYVHYVGNIFLGSWGPSVKQIGKTAQELLWERIPVSLELGFWSMLWACGIGFLLGFAAAFKPRSKIDFGARGLAMLGICLPPFTLAPLLVLFCVFYCSWGNAIGWNSWQDRILPSLTLGLMYAGALTRLLRNSLLEVLNQDYLRTAKAKGLSKLSIYLKHALKNALCPVITYLGPMIAALMSGSIVVETLYNIPGVGRLFLQALNMRDDSVVMACVLFYACLILFCNATVDCVLIQMNPRLRR